MSLAKQALSYVRAISPYQPGKPITELAREMGIPVESIVKLASNENPLGIGEKTREAIQAALTDIARYPDGNGDAGTGAPLRLRSPQKSCSFGQNRVLFSVGKHSGRHDRAQQIDANP